MAEPRIALAMISGDGTKPEQWRRIFASTKGVVDGVYISYNGSDLDSFFDQVIEAQKATDSLVSTSVTPRAWDDDFAAARNHSFSQIKSSDYDWVLWLDTDDELVNGEKIKRNLPKIDPNVASIFMVYRYVVNEDGSTVVTQWRERLLRVTANPRWRRRIHEACSVDEGWQMLRTPDVWVDHHREDHNEQRTRERNRRILQEACRQEPDEPSYLWYMAHEMYAEFQALARAGAGELAGRALELALRTYMEYVKRFANQVKSDDPYIALVRIAEGLRMQGRWNDAVEYDLQAIKMRPLRAEAYLGIAHTHFNSRAWEESIKWADLAIERFEKMDEQIDAVEVEALAYSPHIFKAQAYEEMGRYADAVAEYELCARLAPHINNLAPKIAELHALISKDAAANVYRAMTKGKPGKSIAFVTRPLFEPWHPEIEKVKGSGGAEKCVQEVAKRFAADGWRTVVFGTPGPERGLYEADGVEYLSSLRDYDPAEHFRVTVASRTPEVFGAQRASDLRVLWMHDVNVGEGAGPVIPQADVVVGLTDWHVTHLTHLYGLDRSKMAVVPNGFEADVFKDWGTRVPGRFVYASSPDRGLLNLLEMWPFIRRLVPDATLDVFYGWTGVDALLSMAPDHPIRIIKERVQGTFEQVQDGSITWHDRVPRADLARFYATADAWLYPTDFMETYCITALEMQAAGVTPLVSDLAALTEVVPPQFRVKGYPGNDDYRRRYLDRLAAITQADDGHREAWRQANFSSTSVRTWDHSYEAWRNLLIARGIS